MSKLSMFRKATGLGAKEEEAKEDQPVTENHGLLTAFEKMDIAVSRPPRAVR